MCSSAPSIPASASELGGQERVRHHLRRTEADEDLAQAPAALLALAQVAVQRRPRHTLTMLA